MSDNNLVNENKHNAIELIERFNNDRESQLLIEHYHDKSLPELFAISRREVSHSAFLSKVFSENSFHNCGTYPFLALLRILFKRYRMQSASQKTSRINEVSQLILTQENFVSDVKVDTEEIIKDKTSKSDGRVDIVLRANILPQYIQTANNNSSIIIIIENKIDSKEHDEQTELYYNHYSKLYDDHNSNNKDKALVLFAYLTPKPSIELDTLTEVECTSKQFIQINYQDLLDGVLIPLKARTKSPRAQFILEEYIKSLGISFEDTYAKSGKLTVKSNKVIIMAITPEYRELLTAFFEHNKELIQASLEAISSDANQDGDIREDAEDCLNSIKKLNSRDNTKYSVSLPDGKKSNLGKGKLVLAVIENYAIMHHQAPEEIINTFKQAKQIIKPQGEIEDKERRRYFMDSPIKLNGKDYVVDNQWGQGPKFDNFLKQAKKAGYTISPVL